MAAPRRRRVDLHALPRFEDGWSFLYTEKSKVEREENGILLLDEHGRVPVPAAAISVLLCGPGTSVSHAAVGLLADHGCSIVWVGENGVRFYAGGAGETRKSANLLHQATLWANPETRIEVVHRMYRLRFDPAPPPSMNLQQLRGLEGVRVRDAYARASRETGVPWSGRSYKQQDWGAADPVNRALSAANACLYGLCHAAIVATGFSPALGFIHTGNALSFVYDIADLYKIALTVPLAFRAVQEGRENLERRTRQACREAFFEHNLLSRLVPDIQALLGLRAEATGLLVHGVGQDQVAALWAPDGDHPGGVNYGDSGPE